MECTSTASGHNNHIGHAFGTSIGKRLDCTITSTEGNLVRFTTEDDVKHIRWNHDAEGLREIQDRIDAGEAVTGRYSEGMDCIIFYGGVINLCNTMNITPCKS